MLSVRSLAKKGFNRLAKKIEVDPSATALFGSPAALEVGALVGADPSSAAGGSNGHLVMSQSCPPPLNGRYGSSRSHGHRRVGFDASPDEAEAAPAAEEQEDAEPVFRCPSFGEVYSYIAETVEQYKRQGAGEVLIASLVLAAVYYVITHMVAYLQAVFNLQVPDSSAVMGRVWGYYHSHPVLCLTLNFAIAIAIGAIFLFWETIKATWRRMKDRWERLSRYGYNQLEESEKGAFFSAVSFSKRSKLHPSLSYLDAFGILDKDSGGSISVNELKLALTKAGTGGRAILSEDDIQRGISQVDVNGDGELQLDEFKTFWSLLQADFARQQQQEVQRRRSIRLGEQMPDLSALRVSDDVESAQTVEEAAAPEEPELIPIEVEDDEPASEEDVRKELRVLTDQAEELEVQWKVRHRKSPYTTDAKVASEALKQLQKRCQSLRAGLDGIRNTQTSADAKVESKATASATSTKSPPFVTRLMRSAILQVLARSANGIFSVGLYFADLVSDVQVSVLLWTTGNITWAAIGIFLLTFQFLVVQVRVLPYLQSTFGSSSSVYLFFLFFGFPFGLCLGCFMRPTGPLGVYTFGPHTCLHSAAVL